MRPFSNINRPIVLASASPRRQEIMRQAGFQFTVRASHVDESFPADLPVADVALYLARKKAASFRPVSGSEIIITADTTVVIDDLILNKAADREEGIAMLQTLSGKTHRVITGVCILTAENEFSFQDETLVTFKNLSQDEIEYYLDQYRPYDKAGAYGIQDWIGLVGITRIEGSYFNVVGLPIQKLWKAIREMQ